jgi:hypothetical protein
MPEAIAILCSFLIPCVERAIDEAIAVWFEFTHLEGAPRPSVHRSQKSKRKSADGRTHRAVELIGLQERRTPEPLGAQHVNCEWSDEGRSPIRGKSVSGLPDFRIFVIRFTDHEPIQRSSNN